jgi:hypothetical protein
MRLLKLSDSALQIGAASHDSIRSWRFFAIRVTFLIGASQLRISNACHKSKRALENEESRQRLSGRETEFVFTPHVSQEQRGNPRSKNHMKRHRIRITPSAYHRMILHRTCSTALRAHYTIANKFRR